MEIKNTLTEFLMTDLDLIHDLHDIIDSEEINDTINILNSLRFQIFHTFPHFLLNYTIQKTGRLHHCPDTACPFFISE